MVDVTESEKDWAELANLREVNWELLTALTELRDQVDTDTGSNIHSEPLRSKMVAADVAIAKVKPPALAAKGA